MGGKRGGKGRRKKTSSNSNQQRNRHNDGSSGNHPQHGDDSRTQVKFANGGGGGGDNSNRGGMDQPDYSRSSRPVEEYHQTIDPPPDHSGSGSRPSRSAAAYEEAYGSDPSKFEEGQLLRREQVLREVYSYSDESDADGGDNNNSNNNNNKKEYQQMQHDNGEPMCYDEQQPLQDEHEQYSNHNWNGDHSFTQFNIQPQFQQQQQQKPPKPKRKEQPKEPSPKRKPPKRNYSLSDMSDEEEEQQEDEEAPLFFSPSNNFDSATDNYTDKHAKGVGWGVDYLSERAHRKEKERKKHNFEMDEQRRKREKELWWWQGNDDDDEYDNDPTSRGWDEIDFDDYHSPSFSSMCKCRMGRRRQRCVRNVVILFVGFIVIALAVAVAKDKALEAEKEGNRLALLLSGKNNTYGKPSSRWGHRFDDKTNQNKTLTPEQKEAELEKWEDFEMEAANVLADSSPGWDINSKTGGKVNEQEDNATLVDNDYDDGYNSDGYTVHYIQYYDKSSEAYYYYNRGTNSTQWEKPEINAGAVLLGIAYGTGREYVIEDGGIVEEIEGGGIGGGDIRSSVPLTTSEHPDHHEESKSSTSPEINTEAEHAVEAMLASEMDEFTNAEEVLNHYKESYWRWNHPYRIPGSSRNWVAVDTPVFWRIPLSGATTIEQIFTHCYNMIVAGTTGASHDGMSVLAHNVSEHLSVYTLDDGSHYLRIDMNSKEGIEKARAAGLGISGVADVIFSRYIYNVGDLFVHSGHTGRCFTMLRHPVDRAVSMFHNLQRTGNKAVEGMSLIQYANSPLAEENWMVRMLTNSMDANKLGQQHLQIAKEIIGRKCLLGFTERLEESMNRFAKFFRWEEIKSVNTHHSIVKTKEKGVKEKRECVQKYVKEGLNRHQYKTVSQEEKVWQILKEKNELDMELYWYAEALFYKQNVVYDIP